MKVPLQASGIDDHGDLGRRWAGERLKQMITEGVGRAAMVDLGSRLGIITPVTSLYVPTKIEMNGEERADFDKKQAARRGERTESWWAKSGGKADGDGKPADHEAENKEGGTGTRAKGEEGSMGNPSTRAPGHIAGLHLGGREAADLPRAASGTDTTVVVMGRLQTETTTAAESQATAAATAPAAPLRWRRRWSRAPDEGARRERDADAPRGVRRVPGRRAREGGGGRRTRRPGWPARWTCAATWGTATTRATRASSRSTGWP